VFLHPQPLLARGRRRRHDLINTPTYLPPEVPHIMPSIGPAELIVVLVIALLVLGPKRLPAAGRSLGQGMREFKDSLTSATKLEERSVEGTAERS
jgi:sec-independent protein translocase protein TatA